MKSSLAWTASSIPNSSQNWAKATRKENLLIIFTCFKKSITIQFSIKKNIALKMGLRFDWNRSMGLKLFLIQGTHCSKRTNWWLFCMLDAIVLDFNELKLVQPTKLHTVRELVVGSIHCRSASIVLANYRWRTSTMWKPCNLFSKLGDVHGHFANHTVHKRNESNPF